MSNFSPVSSAARAGAKSINQHVHSDMRGRIARIGARSMTRSRAHNYKAVISQIRRICGEHICLDWEAGSKKDRVHYIVTLGSADNGADIGVAMFQIPFKDPKNYRDMDLNVIITKHVRERLFQRHSDDYRVVMRELGHLIGQLREIDKLDDGKYEVGAGQGLFVVTMHGEPRQLRVTTYVDDYKLREEQSAKIGEARRIK